jgi:hypothetical protein
LIIRISTVLLSMLFACAMTLQAQGKASAEKEARILKGDDKGAAVNNRNVSCFHLLKRVVTLERRLSPSKMREWASAASGWWAVEMAP